jgi:SAM-dependent methyltransferase
VSFDVPADAYGRFMGRFSEPLAAPFADVASVSAGQTALDVGCGPGALTAVLADRLGADAVAGIDPSEPFVAAARSRLPDVDIRRGGAETLPWDDDTFDRTLAQLVVHFMRDPVAGLREMGRVTRADGVVAACVWDHGGGRGPLSAFWKAAHDIDPSVRGEGGLPGSRAGHLVELAGLAGLRDVREHVLTVTVRAGDFQAWWEPYTFGVGPAGEYVASLAPEHRERLRARCHDLLGDEVVLTAAAWTVTARPG